ncbi:tyrosine-protein kinase [Aquimarina addita]|uniref:non-specific protein-tyrosine kinase n=1 Tax=Aquimarina addita TaxID=870485 RepID=A0ABP6UI50_9FLAO
MKEPMYVLDTEGDDSLSLKENLYKYLDKWPWFILSIFLCLLIGFLYIRYAPVIYSSEAKIKIIDDSKDFDIAEDALSLLGGGSKINLDNEIAVITSYRLIDQVVTSLGLDVKYYEVGNLKTRQIFESPILISKLFLEDSIKNSIVYKVQVDDGLIQISNEQDETVTIDGATAKVFMNTRFPIEVKVNKKINLKEENDKSFLIKIDNKKKAVIQLMGKIDVEPLSSKSDVLSIKMKNESSKLSEGILNELIAKFNEDGIVDRQLVSKRTLDFIDDRFLYLSEELDSIEVDKKEYKQSNNLSYIEADAGMTIESKTLAESEVFRIETQIELSKLLKNTLNNQSNFSLLPADIGVENANINGLIFEYNQAVLQREKLVVSAGENNPAVRLLSSQIETAKQNINNTVNTYQNQLSVSLRQLKRQENAAGASFSKLPEKEKRLRSIERQQLIKENLFLLLLQKREEAAINFAVTAPSVKVVDYGLTSLSAVSPKKPIILAISLIIGTFIPLAFFFTKYSFDTKIKTKADLEKLSGEIPILAEIPYLENATNFFNTNERSAQAESFRILSTNVNYLLPNKEDDMSQVVFVTSAVKGEGKTFVAINLAMAFASLRKKVLLIGADLRNPQLHTYFKTDKNMIGLSNFLHDAEITWRDCIYKGQEETSFLEICFGGPIPPNPAQLIAGDNFDKFITLAKDHYDYVIVDTAPTVQVADTLLMSNHADVTVFITRSNFTDKRLIQFSKELYTTKKLKNMAFVLNDVKFDKRVGYNYGYEYGYGVK